MLSLNSLVAFHLFKQNSLNCSYWIFFFFKKKSYWPQNFEWSFICIYWMWAVFVSQQYLVTGRCVGIVGVTATGLTASSTCQVPVIGSTVITGLSNNVRQTLTLSCGTLAHAVISSQTLTALRAQEVASALWVGKSVDIFIILIVHYNVDKQCKTQVNSLRQLRREASP